MGGHGGLNILPQKRWNVYNYSNRQQVEKDQQKVSARQQKREEEEQKSVGQLRLDILKKKSERDQKFSQKKQSSEVKPNALTKEFAEIVTKQQNKNLNLFSEEQKYNDNKEESKARFDKKQKSKDSEEPKYYDSSNKFLGNHRENFAKAWYLKHSGEEVEECNWIAQKRKNREKAREKEKGNELENCINQFRSQTDKYYKVLECELDKKVKNNQEKAIGFVQQQILEDKLRRKEKKEKKKLKKLEKKARKMEKKQLKKIGEDNQDNQENDKQKRNKLRIERLQREQSERQREQELIKKKFPFEFQY